MSSERLLNNERLLGGPRPAHDIFGGGSPARTISDLFYKPADSIPPQDQPVQKEQDPTTESADKSPDTQS